jgi:hypothetical protein
MKRSKSTMGGFSSKVYFSFCVFARSGFQSYGREMAIQIHTTFIENNDFLPKKHRKRDPYDRILENIGLCC